MSKANHKARTKRRAAARLNRRQLRAFRKPKEETGSS